MYFAENNYTAKVMNENLISCAYHVALEMDVAYIGKLFYLCGADFLECTRQ